jgi:muramoyltetrapeptide carboxypeptidase LdcA involved in peptidoglycan recycling
MHRYTVESLRRALFERGVFELTPAPEYSDEDRDWGEPATLQEQPAMYTNTGWKWLNAGSVVEGVTWGGCLEIIDWHLRVNKFLLQEEAYRGKILYLETSEELPSATYVYRMLMCMGERGLLQQFAAVLVARPKAWSLECRNSLEEKARFIAEQEEAITAALTEYHPGVLVVFNMDFGHTDPQCVMPNGGWIKVDGVQRRMWVEY